ncbi:DUF5810 domain-containing protein [Natronorubrum texcoconense]|uniref:Uncharacterized protein n=1 Tax=Natronorubrum texcoconense TaxID=1095776 RepID=A0A1G9FDW6_9EURY|nr:DUF5810 domain-containing protein [Natronorubrum texcoconense]SDK86413.1 hypothetical protein SAMN04515672_4179 [Natronorubrum texcoconense]
MGYACPVCGAEQADAAHLANHLAITASLGREDHREWLEEYAPDWGDCSPEELGERVTPHAPEIETPDFESASHGHDHGRPDGLEGGIAQQSRQPGRGSLTAEAEDVLQEARELTRQMQAASDADDDIEDNATEGSGDDTEDGGVESADDTAESGDDTAESGNENA